MRNYWSLNRRVLTFFILFMGIVGIVAIGWYVISRQFSGASYVAPRVLSSETSAPTSVCSISASLSVAFGKTSGELHVSASKYRTSGGAFAYKGSGFLSGEGKRYGITAISSIDCALPTQQKDGSLARAVAHIEAMGMLAGSTVPEPLILNLDFASDGTPKIDSFTVIPTEGATEDADWFGTDLAASGTLTVNQSALPPISTAL